MREPWVSIDDVARHLDIARETVYRWIDTKGLPAHKVGRLWKFKLDEIDEWVLSGGASQQSAREEREQKR